MSDIKQLPLSSFLALPELDELIDRIVQKTLAQAGFVDQSSPFINSKACADLLGVSPEHLSAMRARGQGPLWSGEGKWIRYKRSDAISWLAQLPTTSQQDANPSTEK